MARDLELAAQLKVNDQMSGPLAAAAAKSADAIDKLAKSDEALATSAKKVAEATNVRMSASRAAELAIKKEADADNLLEHAIANVNEEYARLRAQAAQQIRATGQIEEATLKAAAAIKEKGERLGLLRSALDSVTGGMASMPPMLALLQLGIKGATMAVGAFDNELKNADTSLKELEKGITMMTAMSVAFKDMKEATQGGNAFQRNIVPYIDAIFGDPMEKLQGAMKLRAEMQAAAKEAEAQQKFNAEFTAKESGFRAAEQQAREQEKADLDARIHTINKVAELNAASAAAKKKAHDDHLRQLDAEERKQEAIARKAEQESAKLAAAYKKEGDEWEAAKDAAMKWEISHANLQYKLQAQIDKGLNDVAMGNMQRRDAIAHEQAKHDQQVAQGLGSAMGSAIGQLISGTAKADVVMKKMLLNIAAMLAKIALMNAFAGAFGGVGGIFGGALASGLFGGIGMAEGGWVQGGVKGRDSVRAILMPGEYVVSNAERSAAKSDPMAMTRMVSRIVSGPNGGGGAISDPSPMMFADGGNVPGGRGGRARRGRGGDININISTLQAPPGQQLQSFVRTALPTIRRLQRDGY